MSRNISTGTWTASLRNENYESYKSDVGYVGIISQPVAFLIPHTDKSLARILAVPL